MAGMVNGVNGVGAGTSAEELKAFVQELIEETLATKGIGEQKQTVAESADEESGVISEEQQTAETTEVENPLTGFLTSITSLFSKMMDAMTQMLGSAQNNGTQQGNASDGTNNQTTDTGNTKYTMTEDEKAYLTLHPDYVKNLIAEEKYEEEYGSETSKFKQSINEVFKESRLERIANSVTDEEVQAYLQLHPDVIKDAIASGK